MLNFKRVYWRFLLSNILYKDILRNILLNVIFGSIWFFSGQIFSEATRDAGRHGDVDCLETPEIKAGVNSCGEICRSFNRVSQPTKAKNKAKYSSGAVESIDVKMLTEYQGCVR